MDIESGPCSTKRASMLQFSVFQSIKMFLWTVKWRLHLFLSLLWVLKLPSNPVVQELNKYISLRQRVKQTCKWNHRIVGLKGTLKTIPFPWQGQGALSPIQNVLEHFQGWGEVRKRGSILFWQSVGWQSTHRQDAALEEGVLPRELFLAVLQQHLQVQCGCQPPGQEPPILWLWVGSSGYM